VLSERKFSHLLYRLLCVATMMIGVGGYWLIQRRPVSIAQGIIVVDGLSCLVLFSAGLLMLTMPVQWRQVWQLLALIGAMTSGHIAGLAGGLLAATALSRRWDHRLAGLALAGGYLGIGGNATSWWITLSGDGLNSVSFVSLLVGAALAVGALDGAMKRVSSFEPLMALTALAALLRLYSVGPWNLGWQFATLLVGSSLALHAAWRAVTAQDAQDTEVWLQRGISSLALIATGCATPAGVVATGLLVLHLSVRQLGQPALGVAPWAGWLLTGAVPGSLGFMAFWSVSAAAMAAGIAVLAMVVWATALCLMLAAGRQISGTPQRRGALAAVISLAAGLATPILVRWMLRPLSDHLQGGLTPYGAIEPWGWAGLLALDAGSHPAATAPGLVLLIMLGLIGALAWVIIRWRERG